MVGQPVGELFARKHLLKYLWKNLDPRSQQSTRWGRSLSEEITHLLLRKVRLIPMDDPKKMRHSIRLGLDPSCVTDLNPATHKRLMTLVAEFFEADFHATVTSLHRGVMPLPIRESVEMFRREYGITEDDYPLVNSMRSYERYQKKRGSQRRRGRPKRTWSLRRER